MYYSAVSVDNMRFTLILEDLEGPYRQIAQGDGIDFKTAQMAVAKLGRFHGPLANNP
jgi:hypothetical protein